MSRDRKKITKKGIKGDKYCTRGLCQGQYPEKMKGFGHPLKVCCARMKHTS